MGFRWTSSTRPRPTHTSPTGWASPQGASPTSSWPAAWRTWTILYRHPRHHIPSHPRPHRARLPRLTPRYPWPARRGNHHLRQHAPHRLARHRTRPRTSPVTAREHHDPDHNPPRRRTVGPRYQARMLCCSQQPTAWDWPVFDQRNRRIHGALRTRRHPRRTRPPQHPCRPRPPCPLARSVRRTLNRSPQIVGRDETRRVRTMVDVASGCVEEA